MTGRPDLVSGRTWHGRRGSVRNGFSYRVDYLCLNAEDLWPRGPFGFARNRRALVSIRDRDHGGPPGQGGGATWVRSLLSMQGIPEPERIELLTQPRVLGSVFNPVSFWLCYCRGGLTTVIAEVNNTFGERHCYLCRRDDGGPITEADRLQAQKIFYVSPFQPVAGTYSFRFAISPDRIAIRIDYRTEAEEGDSAEGLVATLSGRRRPLGFGSMVGLVLRRPLNGWQVLGLIFWQALKLRLKGALYRVRGPEPDQPVSVGHSAR